MGPKVTPETYRNAVAAIVSEQTGKKVDPEALEVIKETYRSAVANAEVSEVTPETFRKAVATIVPEQTGKSVDSEALGVIEETYRNAMPAAEVPKEVGSDVGVPDVTPETFRTAVEAIVPVQTGTEVDSEALGVIEETYRSAVAGAEIPKELGSGVEVPKVTPETYRNAVAAIVSEQTGKEVDPEALEVIEQTYRNAVASAEVPIKIGSGVDGPKVVLETFRNAAEAMVPEQTPAKQLLVPDQKVPEIIQQAYRNAIIAAAIVPQTIKEDVTAGEEMRMSG